MFRAEEFAMYRKTSKASQSRTVRMPKFGRRSDDPDAYDNALDAAPATDRAQLVAAKRQIERLLAMINARARSVKAGTDDDIASQRENLVLRLGRINEHLAQINADHVRSIGAALVGADRGPFEESPMSRRKHLVAREPSGRPRRVARDPDLLSPGEVRRMIEGAKAGLRDAVWGSALGRLQLTGKLTSSQFAPGKRWAEVVAGYDVACRAPSPPRSARLEPGVAGAPVDCDSVMGEREARQHQRAVLDYLSGRNSLRLAGSAAERVVDSVCVQDRAPAGLHELDALRTGLQSLSTWWSARRKAGPR
jgi:hypothetical protein